MSVYSVEPGGGDARWMYDSVDTIKADASQTGGAFALVEFRTFEGSSPPTHVHSRFDNGLYVLEGKFTFHVGDESFVAGPGAWVYVPRNVPRTWRCDSSEGRVLSFTAPAGFEEFYREAGAPLADGDPLPERSEPDPDVVGPMAARYGTSIVGPPIGVA